MTAVLFAVVFAGVAPAQETFFYSSGKKVPIELSTDRVAVRLKPEAGKAPLFRYLEDLDRDQRGSFKPLDEFPEQRITILPLARAQTRDGFAKTMTILQEDPLVELVGAVVRLKETGAHLVMTGRIIARLNDNTKEDRVQAVLKRFGLSVVSESKTRRGRLVLAGPERDPMVLLQAANGLFESGIVRYAHPDFYAKTKERTLPNQPHIPDDPMFGDQWHLNNTGQGGGTADADIDAPEAWDFTRGRAEVRIAIIDDAIDIAHEDLSPNVIAGTARDTEDDDNDPSPEAAADRHGTPVAGLAVARGDNAIGVSGSCPQCGLIAIRATDGSIADHAEAFDHAAAHDAWVISNSWGYDVGTLATDDVVDAIEDAATNGRGGLGTVVLFAMTNSRTDNCVAPTPDISSLDTVIAVSRATNQDDLGDGGFGDCMDLLGPTRGGTLGLTSTDWTGANGYSAGDYHANFGGTSGATPIVAGTVGLLLSLNPDLSRAQVQRILEETAEKIDAGDAGYDDSGFSSTHGYGRVNAHRALVPTVRIRAPERVSVGEPFSITVTGTAPYGLRFIWWWGDGTGIVELDKAHMVPAGDEPVFTYTWTGITIDAPGVYSFGANARDRRYPTPGDGYPHQASEGGGIEYATVAVVAARTVRHDSRFPEPK